MCLSVRFPPVPVATLLVAFAVVYPAGSAAVTLTPTVQSRSTNILANASTIDAQGNVTASDSQNGGNFAPDLSPFVTFDPANAATSEASSGGQVEQDSEYLADGVRASGAFSGWGNSSVDGSSSANGTSFCRMSFSIDATAGYTVLGTLDGDATTSVSLNFSGPGLFVSHRADAVQPNVVVNEAGTLVAGSYTFEIRCSGSAFSFRGPSSSTSGAFDLTLQLGGAVDAPLAAAPPAGLTAAPNPFRESTSIRTALPVGSPLRAAVFDVAGRRVRTLAVSSGDAIVWDGRGESGLRVPAGTYLVRLESAGSTSVVKVMAVW